MLDLSRLNPQQRAAVLQTEGPVLVLAGAGSGKTRVIAHRVVHLLDQGVPARAILAVTFTNKAAAEMRERIARLAGDRHRCRGLTVSTFHAFGVRVLREHGARLGLPERFAIFDAGDQGALVKRLLREVKVDDRRFDLGKVVAILSRLRTSGEPGHPDDDYELIAAELKPRYELGLRTMGAVDFDDLLLLPLRLLEDREVLEQYQRRYRYLLVDEYQDTNEAQFRLLSLLAGVRRNLCAVGDDDQSIYSWRGAQVRNILGFDAKFPGGHEVFLEQNYRSTGAILEAANAVIGKNPGRKPKHLWTDRGRGANVRVVCASDDDAEARYVADEVLRVAYEDKLPLGEIAVLYRTNAQARPLEEALRLSGVRYRVVGGTSLFDRKEVRDLIAYLRAALNPKDEVSLLRIVNVPARGIGDQTIARAQELARARGAPVWEVLRAGAPELAHAAERVAEFVALLERYGERLTRSGFSAAARDLCEEVGLFEEARRGAQSPQAQARRVEALEGVLRQLAAFEQRTSTSTPTPTPDEDEDDPLPSGLPGYLARLALDSKDADGDPGNAVTLMTLHGAKGLEWRCVFLCGLEEGLLPHSGRGFDDASAEPSAEGVANLEEERRLAYVGMTRARERLTLTRAAQRLRRGKLVPRTPSRFLDDLPPELVDQVDLSGPPPAAAGEAQTRKARSFFADMDTLLSGKNPEDGER
jgi:DNA helicase-2/ATP-dependent DNA helicase PcrA